MIEQSTFSAARRLLFMESKRNYKHVTYCECATIGINMVAIGL
jgi:hypothetical protein